MYHITSIKRIKYTPNQVKYLFEDLDQYSQHMALLDLCTRLRTIHRYTCHLYTKIQDGHVSFPKWALSNITTLNHYKVIEVNITGKEIRYLLRGTDSFYCQVNNHIRRVNLCIVVSTSAQKIVTAYTNDCTDSHTQLDNSRYIN